MAEDINRMRRKWKAAGIPDNEIAQMTEDYMSTGGGGQPANKDFGGVPKETTKGGFNTSGTAQGAAGAIQSGGSATDVAAGGLVGSGNPYAMAAGLGLSVLSAREKRKQAEQEGEALNKLQRIQRQQTAINNLMDMSQRLEL